MNMPQTADTFIDFMERVWDGYCYDKYHDAIRTAKMCNARKLYGNIVDGQRTYTFEFPDGSRAHIGARGGMVRLINRHR